MSSLPRLAFRHFASCGGCQLTLLNCEEQLALLAKSVELISFPMVTSQHDDGGPVDVVLVEGSVARPEQAAELLALRQRAGFLVAVGACASSGGINRLPQPRQQAYAEVYRHRTDDGYLPQPLCWLVHVDLTIPGCPPEGSELLAAIQALLHGGVPAVADIPVCMECHMREQQCLLHEGHRPCLGTMTRAGCGARCPQRGVGCEGCRGRITEANLDELRTLLRGIGLGDRDIEARLERFGGGRP